MIRPAVKLSRLALLLAALALASSVGASTALGVVPSGHPDPSFGSGGSVAVPGARLLATAVQSDGKVVAVGDDQGTPIRLLVIRVNANGSVDSSFNGGHPALGPAGSIGRAVAIQPDGKIVVAGAFNATADLGVSANGMLIERFNANGSADGGFGSGGVASALGGQSGGLANSVAMQPDGKIVAGGSATAADGYPHATFVRLSSSGRPDPGFGSGGVASVNLGRYSVANAIAVQSDGRIVFGGSERNDLRNTNLLAARLNVSGSLDSSFAGGALDRQFGVGSGVSPANAVALQPDGKIILGGAAGDISSGSTALILRLTAGGSLDPGFGSGGVVKLAAADSDQCCNTNENQGRLPGINAIVVSAGKIFASGFYDSSGRARSALWGLAGNGQLDPGFGTSGRVIGPLGGANSPATGLAVAPGGSLVISGDLTNLFGPGSSFLARFGGPVVQPPPPPPPPRKSLRVSVKLSRTYTIKSVIHSGLRLTVNCSAPCRIRASLTLSYAAAKRLKLTPRHGHPRTVTIGAGSANGRRAGKVKIVLHLRRAAAHALGRQRKISMRLNLTGSSGAASKHISRTVRLVR